MKCIKGNIVLFSHYRFLSVYTFRQTGHTLTELEKFFTKYEDDEQIELVSQAYWEFTERGVQERRFRPAGEGAADAIANGASPMRLYLINCGVDRIVYGNGCLKETLKAQDTPACKECFDFMQRLAKEFTRRLAERELRWIDKTTRNGKRIVLEGDTYFEIGC